MCDVSCNDLPIICTCNVFVGTPDMPRNVTVISETSSSVVFKADAPQQDGGRAVSEWRLTYSRDEDYTDSKQILLSHGQLESFPPHYVYVMSV